MSIICHDCGSSNPDNAKFCNNCGKPLYKTCPKCGATVRYSSNYCIECGCSLTREFALYDEISPLGEDYFSVKVSSIYNFVSAAPLQPINIGGYHYISSVQHDYIAVRRNGKSGVLSIDGLKKVLPIIYDGVNIVSHNAIIVRESNRYRIFNPRTNTFSDYYDKIVSDGKKTFVGKPYSFKQLDSRFIGSFIEKPEVYRYEDIFKYEDDSWYVKEGNSVVELLDDGRLNERNRYYFSESDYKHHYWYMPIVEPERLRFIPYCWLQQKYSVHEERDTTTGKCRFVDRNGRYLSKAVFENYWEEQLLEKHKNIIISLKNNFTYKYLILKVNSIYDLSEIDVLADL